MFRPDAPHWQAKNNGGLPEIMYEFFHIGVHTSGRLLTEDWWFCQHWRDCGGVVWADPTVVLKHIAMVALPLPYQLEHAAALRPPPSVLCPPSSPP